MDLNLKLDSRDIVGKKAKQLVADGKVLGNIYGKGKPSIAVSGEYNLVNKIINESGKNIPVELEVGDEKHLALVHEVERDNLTQRLHHVSFQIIKRGEKVTTEVPVKMFGDAPAERTGKIIVTILDHVEVEAKPSDIPEVFEVSAEVLVEEHDHISVSDLVVPDGVTILNDPELLIAKVDIPRAQVEEEVEEEADEDIDAADVPSEHGSDEDSDDAETEADSKAKSDEYDGSKK